MHLTMKEDFTLRSILRFLLILTTVLLCQTRANAAINLLLTQGINSAQPIAVVPFAGQDDSQALNNVSSVISNDLKNSGRFKPMDVNSMTQFPHEIGNVDYAYWRKANMDSVVIGKVQAAGGDRYRVNFALLDIFKGQSEAAGSDMLAAQQFTAGKNDLRRLAHHISDIIYEKLLGERGIFSTQIAYVLVQRNANNTARYLLEVADMDGYNPRPLLTSNEPIMSPAWSHDGTRIAYVSFEDKRAQIYVANVRTGERRLISRFPGINGAPAWSPDDQKLALVLSRAGIAKIFVMDLASGQLRQVTQGPSIDTEPSWSPDARSLIFTSDRGGSPQIYQLDLNGGQIQRLTFTGEYNASPSFTPDGQHIVMLTRQGGMYNVAIQDLHSGSVQVLTDSGHDDSPSVAPNGRMIIHGSEYGVLGLVSSDGRVKLRLPAREGKVQDPAWSPFLS